jgi:leader peptidase (prepilin peptidase) / N-methyltransferase
VSPQVLAVLASLVAAWPVSVLGWSLPDRLFAPAGVRGAPGLLVGVALSVPVACGLWAAVVVPAFALPGLLILGWTLIALAIVDIRTFTLPDVLTVPLALAGVAHSAWIDGAAMGEPADYFLAAGHAVLAGGAGFLLMAGVAWLFRAARGREGLGLGDAKLLAASGAWLGLAALPTVILLAALGGLVVTVAAHRVMRTRAPLRTMPIPFGPYLAASTWIVALHGPLAVM